MHLDFCLVVADGVSLEETGVPEKEGKKYFGLRIADCGCGMLDIELMKHSIPKSQIRNRQFFMVQSIILNFRSLSSLLMIIIPGRNIAKPNAIEKK